MNSFPAERSTAKAKEMTTSIVEVKGIGGSKSTEIRLLPWDPDSEEHILRLIHQRKACGWKDGCVRRKWTKLQKKAHIALFWVVIEDEEKISLHGDKYPMERLPITDSAIHINGSPRSPTNLLFTPIGHISLDSLDPEYPFLTNRSIGLYCISRFYISRALQSSGIGGAAMDALEHMARGDPINAKTLALATIANEFEGRDERLKAQGRTKPALSLEDWYQRRGYVVFDRMDAAWEEVDLVGKLWPCTAIFMKKELVAEKGGDI